MHRAGDIIESNTMKQPITVEDRLFELERKIQEQENIHE